MSTPSQTSFDPSTAAPLVREISEWISQVATNAPIPPADLIQKGQQVRQKGLDLASLAVPMDENHVPLDPQFRLFYDVLKKHETEARERIMRLVLQGEQSAYAYYDILRDLLSRETALLLLPPLGDRKANAPELDFDKFDQWLRACDCNSCAACVTCGSCVFSVTVVAVTTGATYATESRHGD